MERGESVHARWGTPCMTSSLANVSLRSALVYACGAATCRGGAAGAAGGDRLEARQHHMHMRDAEATAGAARHPPPCGVAAGASVAQHVLQALHQVRERLMKGRRVRVLSTPGTEIAARGGGILICYATLRQQVREQWRTEDATLSRRAWRYASRC